MKKKILLPILAFAVLLIVIAVIFSNRKNKKEPETTTEATTTVEETTTMPPTKAYETDENYNRKIDFDSLKATNPDVIAWVYIPGTVIDYPILWNGDNEYYLHHDIDGNNTVAGSIFLDMDDKPDFSSKHNIFYGHNMKNKSMFQNIIKFKNKDFFEQNRDIYIYTQDKEYHLKTMAALYTDASIDKRQVEFETDEEFKAYIDRMTEKNSYRQIPSDDIDKLWSFITCSYEFNDARTILYAYEVEDK